MKIRLDAIHDEPLRWQESVSISVADLGRTDVQSLSPVACDGRIVRTDAGFLLDARLAWEQQVVCDRCLAHFGEARDERLEVLLVVGHAKTGAGEHELQEEDLGVVRVEGEVLETEPLIAEQVLLSLPVKPLCRPDCAGLCPGCGADLNHEPCRCESKPTDPRWAALAALRGRRGEGA
jgi:uncharacterized protein